MCIRSFPRLDIELCREFKPLPHSYMTRHMSGSMTQVFLIKKTSERTLFMNRIVTFHHEVRGQGTSREAGAHTPNLA